MSSIIRKPTLMEFVNYEIVRRSGKFNMITDMESAAKKAGLDIDQYKNIISNYQWCVDQWKNCNFKMIEIWNDHTGHGRTDVIDDNNKVIIYDLDYAIDDLALARLQFTESQWELEQVH